MRYFIKFAYNGKNYHGFQTQPNATSVQETLTDAMQLLIDKTIEIVGAGRTDSGVHAKQMFAHFDVEKPIETLYWLSKLNSYLPKDIVIYDIFEVDKDTHARFNASARTYEYNIHTHKDAFLENTSWYYFQDLDFDKMNEACHILFNHTDFECFSKANTDVHTHNCTITEAYWKKTNHQFIFTIKADRFLRNMVRAIVGTMINVGIGKTSINEFEKIIESKSRSKAGFSVPAHGLFLVKIEYPFLSK
ncbi:tRNA pseudouridine(38-40) synthase TruA [uncultured Flavobacterium sp.]|uniref:tRNA pseudouridine(38-40) synthase TruA n=1 Tax=uncultured Flavobacterium sp. TaxID=165435 RepID=UPI0030CA16CF